MNFEELDAQQVRACVAALCGIGGIAVVLLAAPRRISWSALALVTAFASLLVGGVVGLRGLSIVDFEWGEKLIAGGSIALVLALFLTVGESRAYHRGAKLATAASDAHRREVDRLAGTNVRLEDELKDARRKVETLERDRVDKAELARATTTRRALESALASERRHRAIFEGAIEGMAILERETLRLVTVNPSLVRMTGLGVEELSQRTLMDLFATVAHQPGKADLLRSAHEGRALSVDIQRNDGQVTSADVSITVIGNGEDAQLLTVVRDVSGRRLLERELEQHVETLRQRERGLADANRQLAERASAIEEMNGRLQRLQAQKDDFVSTVSHELRTPLTSIRSFSEILLKHDDAEPAVRREFLEIINKESERLTRLVNNVLDLARIEAGEARLDVSEFDLREVAADAAASMSGTAAEKQVAIRRDIGSVARILWADRDKIQQIVMNLLSNAIKFSKNGGEVDLVVKEASRPGRIEISVVDQGPGIAPSELERVFEKFRQAGEPAGARTSGTGLGLAISREIAKLHGGRIWAENVLKGGSRFRVELPGVEEGRRIVGAHILATRAAAAHAAQPVPRGPRPDTSSRTCEPLLVPLTAEVDVEDRYWTDTGSLPPLQLNAQRGGERRDEPPGELPRLGGR